MKKTESYTLLIIAGVLLIIGIVLALITYNNSYADSVATGAELTAVKEQITAIEAGNITGDLDALKAQKATLSALKLRQEKPYSYSLTLIFFSVLLLIKGFIMPCMATQKTLTRQMSANWHRPGF